MSRSINPSHAFAMALLCLSSSCAIATFERLEITSNVVSHGQVIGSGGAWLSFSALPDKPCVERLIELTCEGSSVGQVFSWDGNRVSVSPETEWRKDRKYRLALSGSVRLADGRRYQSSFERYFYWTSATDFLTVTASSPAMDAEVSPGERLVVSFNKPIDVNSFMQDFSIKPSCGTRISFSDGNRTVTVEPASRWPLNEVFSWSFDAALSGDGSPLPAPFESRFTSPVDVSIPEVIAVCPVTAGAIANAFDEGVSIDGHLVDDQPFGVVFSEEMSPTSVISALSIEPSLKGYFAKDGSSARRFVFRPLEPYEAGVTYTLRVAASASDALGLSMRRDVEVLFTSLNRNLRVTSIALGDESVIDDFSDKDHLYSCDLSGDALTVAVDFDASIGSERREIVVDKTRLSILFPRTLVAPSLIAARWENGAKRLVMDWKGFSPSVGDNDSFYYLEIPGGKSGVTDGRGQYMEDGVCVVFGCR